MVRVKTIGVKMVGVKNGFNLLGMHFCRTNARDRCDDDYIIPVPNNPFSGYILLGADTRVTYFFVRFSTHDML